MKTTRPPFKVLRDTREQKGWHFPASAACLGTEVATLATGDYTLAGYEQSLAIERKGTAGELFANLLEPRFERELERLETFAYPFLLCEFTFEEVLSFPVGSGIPPARWGRLKGQPAFFLKRLLEIQLRYRTRVLLVGAHGPAVALSLFKRVAQ